MRRTECLFAHSLSFLVFMVGLSGCGGGSDPNKGINVKPTVHVTGKVLVDGVPPETPIAVKAHQVVKTDETQPLSTGGTGKDGVFELNTYNKGDGVPPGEYKLTFLWGKLSMRGGMQGEDLLGGQYVRPDKSEFTIKVTESEGVLDLGVFELKKSAKPTKILDDRN